MATKIMSKIEVVSRVERIIQHALANSEEIPIVLNQ